MPSITSWIRLEPKVRVEDETEGIQARVWDPLWLLGRQWQMGEFQGSDSGSPVAARLRAESANITRYHPGVPTTKVQGRRYDGQKLPLETLVEQEPVRQPHRLVLAVDAGLHFLRLLAQRSLSQSYRAAYVRRYGIAPLTSEQRAQFDAASIRMFELLASRALDGDLLAADLQQLRPDLPTSPLIESGDVEAVKAVVAEWLRWYDGLFADVDKNDSAWVDERMEYAFSVSARTSSRELTLVAREYTQGQLDWYAFNIGGPQLGAVTDAPPNTVTRTTIPAPVSFRGMPAQRWWEFEDAQVHFGAVDTGPEDLARMLLVEFATSFGNDWFVVPVELEAGSLCMIRSLIVTDTFGGRFAVPNSVPGGKPWRMFQLTSDQPSSISNAPPVLFVPPVVLKNVQGPPIEEVVLFRDEMANMAWGVERVVDGPTGRPLNRHDAYYERAIPQVPDIPLPDALRYELASTVPDYWIPFVPVQISGSRAVRLRRAAMLDANGQPQFNRSQGRILTPKPGLRLDVFEEEIPREGIRVSRNYQYTRWLDGSTHVWVGRRKGVGRGEGSSELRFDSLR
ncbi:hypothetical protein [Nitrospira sp. BLG_1]|uniref:hypothetical protein n=1 Tax=Nitrospira sp. BLG_1 TaxID=3395883 RepID=UPI0039BD8448